MFPQPSTQEYLNPHKRIIIEDRGKTYVGRIPVGRGSSEIPLTRGIYERDREKFNIIISPSVLDQRKSYVTIKGLSQLVNTKVNDMI